MTAPATCLATGAGPQTHTAKRWPPWSIGLKRATGGEDRRRGRQTGHPAPLTFTTFDPDKAQSPQGKPPDLELLSAALTELETLDPPLATLVDLHFFCGYTFGEIASLRGVSERTVQRDWTKARVLLQRFLDEGLEAAEERSLK